MPGGKKKGGRGVQRGRGRLQRGSSLEPSCRPRAEYRGKTLETEAAREQQGGRDRRNKEGGINS